MPDVSWHRVSTSFPITLVGRMIDNCIKKMDILILLMYKFK
jgi:hypothetical protein